MEVTDEYASIASLSLLPNAGEGGRRPDEGASARPTNGAVSRPAATVETRKHGYRRARSPAGQIASCQRATAPQWG